MDFTTLFLIIFASIIGTFGFWIYSYETLGFAIGCLITVLFFTGWTVVKTILLAFSIHL